MQTNLFQKKAVLIESDEVQTILYQDILKAYGFDVFFTPSVVEALMFMRNSKPDVCIINTDISDTHFLNSFLNNVKSSDIYKNIPIIGILISEAKNKEFLVGKFDGIIRKPFYAANFIKIINSCINCVQESEAKMLA